MDSFIGFLLLAGVGLLVASVAGAAGLWAALAVAGAALVVLAIVLAVSNGPEEGTSLSPRQAFKDLDR